MKNILTPTDFSDISDNAVNYAFGLAQSIKAFVTLYHCFHVPVISTDVTVTTIDFEEVEKESIKLLTIQKMKLQQKYPDVKIDMVSSAGFAADEIVEYSKQDKFDLIVMGISSSGNLPQLLGSTMWIF